MKEIILAQDEKKVILDSIREIKDFPKPGILFRDITTLLNNPQTFKLLMDHLEKRYKNYDLNCVAGIESRGFIFGTALADRLNVSFVPIRKKGKLPYTTISEKYTLEYGVSEIEVHVDAFKKDENVLLIDDLLATGGTACAAAKLIKQCKANCVESCFILNLVELAGEKALSEFSKTYCVLDI